MDISTINNQASTRPGSETPTPTSKVSKDTFLNLLVAQLKNQDPLEPTSNTEFLGQLASFQSLENQTETNKTLTSLVGVQESQLALQGLSQAALLVGKSVTWTDPATKQASSGIVDGVTVENGVMMVHSGKNKVPIGSLTGIGVTQPPPTATTPTTSPTTTPTAGSAPTGAVIPPSTTAPAAAPTETPASLAANHASSSTDAA